MLLAGFQQLLAGIYDLPLAQDINQFLFTDRARLPAAARDSGTDEQLLVAEQDGSAAIGLFFDAGLLQRLQRTNPLQGLHGGNIADFWTVLEGVSHFMYLAWHAGHDRPVSLLELELQAEVDKYVGSVRLLRAQHPTHFPRELHHLLFERSHIDPHLAGERAGLYRRAHRYAALFCRRLEQRLEPARPERVREMDAELRRFYRWTAARKTRHIEDNS